MNSAIFEGSVRHRRRTPVENAFKYGLYMLYLDLSELETVFKGRWLWSARGFNIAWFRRAGWPASEVAWLFDVQPEQVAA